MSWVEMIDSNDIIDHDNDNAFFVTWNRDKSLHLWTFKMDGTFTRWAEYNLPKKPTKLQVKKHAKAIMKGEFRAN